MAVTEAATITDQVARPGRVTIYGRDSSDGTLRPISVGTDGQLQLNLTGEGLALDVSVDGVEAKLDTGNASLAVLDDWDESDRAKVNPIAGQAGVAGAAGTVSALTQRVVQGGAATATQTSVDSVTTAGGVTILAAAAGRLGATITNTDANALYLYFAAAGTVSSSVFNVKLLTDETLVLEAGGYTGIISGVWAGDGSGAAKVCEFTT